MARDLSELPRVKAAAEANSNRPDAPAVTKLLTDVWFQHRVNQPQRPTVLEGQPFRPSKSGSCERSIWYGANGFEETDPPDIAAHWSFEMGQMVHDWFDHWMPIAFPGVEVEKQYIVELPNGTEIGGNADAYHPELKLPGMEPVSAAFELKSINGFGFKKATQGKAPEGPRDSALIQGCLAGLGLDADMVFIVNNALEVTSAGVAAKAGIEEPVQRFTVEWAFSRDEYEPIALRELARVQQALEPAPAAKGLRRPVGIPVMAEVQNPATGHWVELNDNGQPVNTGNCWQCNYCNFQKLCVDDHKAGDTLKAP